MWQLRRSFAEGNRVFCFARTFHPRRPFEVVVRGDEIGMRLGQRTHPLEKSNKTTARNLPATEDKPSPVVNETVHLSYQ